MAWKQTTQSPARWLNTSYANWVRIEQLGANLWGITINMTDSGQYNLGTFPDQASAEAALATMAATL